MLYALGQPQAGAGRLIPFDHLERPLERLLEEFGPPRKSPHPELTFYHFQNDGVWEIEERILLTRRKGSKESAAWRSQQFISLQAHSAFAPVFSRSGEYTDVDHNVAFG